MSGLSKEFVLLLMVVLVFSSLFFVGFCVAPVTVPANPSFAPEVSVEIQHNPLVIPPTYSTNPYTGETQQVLPESIDPQGNVTITIKNRSFNAYIDKDGNTINVYYVFFIKPEFQLWDSPQYAVYQSNSEYTTITFPYSKYCYSDFYPIQVHRGMVWNFRVQAVTGYFTPGYEVRPGYPDVSWYYVDPVYEGEGSAFTEFTITISNSDKPSISKPVVSSSPGVPAASSPVSSPQSTPPQKPSQFNRVIVRVLVALCVLAFMLAVAVLFVKQRRQSPF